MLLLGNDGHPVLLVLQMLKTQNIFLLDSAIPI